MKHFSLILIFSLKIINIFGNLTNLNINEGAKTENSVYWDPVNFFYFIELILQDRPGIPYYLNVITTQVIILCNDFTETEKKQSCYYADNQLKQRGKILYDNVADKKKSFKFKNLPIDIKCFPIMAIRSNIGEVRTWYGDFPLNYILVETQNNTKGYALFGREIYKKYNDVANISINALEAFENEIKEIQKNIFKLELKKSKRGCYASYAANNDTNLMEMSFIDSTDMENYFANLKPSHHSKKGSRSHKYVPLFYFSFLIFLLIAGIILTQLLPQLKLNNRIQSID